MAESMDYESELLKGLSKLHLLQDTKVEKHRICAEIEGSTKKKMKVDPDKEDEVCFMFPKTINFIHEKMRVDLKRVLEESLDAAQQVNKYATDLENLSTSHLKILTLSEEPEQLREIQDLSTSTLKPSSSLDWASLSKKSGSQELITHIERTIGRLKYFKERLRQQRRKFQAACKPKENISLDLASQIEKMSLSKESGTHQRRKMTANPNISLDFSSQIERLISFKKQQLRKMQGNATSSPVPNISWHFQTQNGRPPRRFFQLKQRFEERRRRLGKVSWAGNVNMFWDLASYAEKEDTNMKAGSQEQTMMEDQVTSIEKPSTTNHGR